MAALLSSPRRRRRLAWTAAAATPMLAVVAAVALLPGRNPQVERTAPVPTAQQPAAVSGVIEPPTVKLAPRLRREITAALDRFIVTGVAGSRPDRAWGLTTDSFHRANRKSDWAKGNTPFWRYPADGTHFPGWVLKYSYPGDVGLDIFLQPKPGADTGPIAFRAEFKRVAGRWLLETWQPEAQFSRPGESAKVLAQPDLAPGLGEAGERRLSAKWLLLPLGLLAGSIVLIPVAVAVAGWRKNRAVARFLDETRERERRAA